MNEEEISLSYQTSSSFRNGLSDTTANTIPDTRPTSPWAQATNRHSSDASLREQKEILARHQNRKQKNQPPDIKEFKEWVGTHMTSFYLL